MLSAEQVLRLIIAIAIWSWYTFLCHNTYDSDNTIFSPQGRLVVGLHQYALDVVKRGSAAVSLRSKMLSCLPSRCVVSVSSLVRSLTHRCHRCSARLASYQQKCFVSMTTSAIADLTSDARSLRPQVRAAHFSHNIRRAPFPHLSMQPLLVPASHGFQDGVQPTRIRHR